MESGSKESSNKVQAQDKSLFTQFVYFLQRRDQNGYDREGYDPKGFDRLGFDKRGFNRNGFDKFGFDRHGYDIAGYNKQGFNGAGDHRNGGKFDENGWDSRGFDKNGFNKDGLDKLGKSTAYYADQIRRMHELLKDARGCLKSGKLSYAARDIRGSLEIGMRILLNHSGRKADGPTELGKWIQTAEYYSLLEPTLLQELRSAKQYCDTELHESDERTSHPAMKWAYHRAEKLFEIVKT